MKLFTEGLCGFALFAALVTVSVARAKYPPFQATVAADGQAAQYIVNYISVGYTEGSKKGQNDVWAMSCVQQPCSLFKKGDAVSLEYLGERKVGTKFHNEKRQIYRICTTATGCFESALLCIASLGDCPKDLIMPPSEPSTK
jgi:hypothetical protein